MKQTLFFIAISLFGCGHQGDEKDESIPYSKFKEETIGLVKVMRDSSQSFCETTAIRIVKTHNSLRIYNISEKDSLLYREFNSAIKQPQFNRIIDILDMELSLGMSYYSKKYDLKFGCDSTSKSSYLHIRE